MGISKRTLVALTLVIGALPAARLAAAISNDDHGKGKTENHPAVGSYFGRATQVCAPSAPCPQIALLMTPSLTGDGIFIGNDSLTLGSAPFGPHTTAHGQWVPTSRTGFVADYTFMLPPTPPTPNPSVSALRFRWLANMVGKNTIVGFVNIYFFPPIPIEWQALGMHEFPEIPDEAAGIITSPQGVVTDPGTCTAPGCPLVFKFTVKRVAP